MAEKEIRKVITIDASKSIKSLRDMKVQIDTLQTTLKKLDKTGDEYQATLVKTKAAQAAYNQEMRLAVKESKAAKGSYNDLVNQLARLKEQWKATGDAAKRAEIGKRVNEVKGQINALDHSIGNWQRNVGNYWGSLRNGLGKLAVGLVAVKGAMKTFQSAMDSTQSTGDALRNTISAVKSSYDTLMTAVVSTDWSFFSGGFWAVYDAAKAAAEAIDQLGNSQLAYDYLSSKNVTAFNEQYNIWKDSESTKEMKDAAKAQMKSIIDEQFKYAAGYSVTALDAYRKSVVEQAGSANLNAAWVTTDQFVKAMQIDVSADPAKGRAEIDRQYAEYQRKLKEYGKNNIVAQDNLKKQYRDVISIHAMLQLMANDELQNLEGILKSMESATQTAQNMQRRMLRGGGSTTTRTTATPKVNELQKLIEEYEGNADAIIAALDAQLNAEISIGIKVEQNEQKKAADREKREAASAKKHEEYLLRRNDAEAKADEQRAKGTIDNEKALADTLYRIQTQANQKRLIMLRQFVKDALAGGRLEDAAAYQQQAADLEVQIQLDAITEKARLRRQDTKDAEDNAKKQKETLKKVGDSTASLFGNVASAYQAYLSAQVEGGKMSEKAAEQQFEAVKSLQYAQTWINTLSGMMSVWSGEGTTAFKIAQSAAVFSQGLAATMQIANTTLGSVSAAAQAATSTATAAPVIFSTMPQVQAVTSASQDEVLNQRASAQRVYVVYNDIAQAGRKVQVTRNESRF